MKVTLTLNEKQIATMMAALDLFSRVGWGQLRFLDDMYADRDYDRDAVREHLDAIKEIVFPELGGADVRQPRPKRAQISWDIYQVIRNAYAWHRRPEGGITVDFDKPMCTSGEPIPEICISEEEEEGSASKK